MRHLLGEHPTVASFCSILALSDFKISLTERGQARNLTLEIAFATSFVHLQLKSNSFFKEQNNRQKCESGHSKSRHQPFIKLTIHS